MPDGRSRRDVLAATGSLITVGIAGCVDNSSRPRYERRTIEVPAAAEPRTPAETTAAAQQATTDSSSAVAPTTAVDLTDHAFVFEPGYLGATVQGTVRNRAESRIGGCEVRVRVYDGEGRLLGHYFDRVSGLGAGTAWQFTVIVLESPGDLAAYEIAALAIPP